MNKNIKAVLCVAALLVVAAFVLRPYLSDAEGTNALQSDNTKKSAKSPLKISVAVLKPDVISETLITVGDVMPDELVNLSFENAGKLTEILFSEGETVEAGQLLAKINDAPLQAQLKRLEADIPIHENKVYRREQLLKTEAISQEDYDIAIAEYNKLKADMELVKAEIEKCNLVAPFSGKVGLRNVSDGAFVTTSTTITTLTKLNPLKLQFSYPEHYASRVEVGDNVNFKLTDGLKKYKARIYAIEPNVDDVTKTITARAIFTNYDKRVVPGRFVSVELNLDDKKNALSVVSEAVTLELGSAFVYRYSAGKVEKVEVNTGIRNETKVEITSGVSKGDTIATSGLMQLRDGMSVELR